MAQSRKLIALMFADIVGYMALLGRDDIKAVRLLRQNRAIHRELVPQFNGRLIAEIEDGIFSGFELPDEGVRCAIELQKALLYDKHLTLRIGIHSGAFRKHGGRLSGEAAAGAALLESTAEAGGLCISGTVYSSLQELPGISSIYLGTRHAKGIKGAMSVYALAGYGLISPKEKYQHRP